MEKVKAIKRTVEQEGFEATCTLCGLTIFGSTENQVVFNLATHKKGKKCFEQRVQNELPKRTPGYGGYISPAQDDFEIDEEKNKILEELSQTDENVSTEDRE